MYQTIATMDNEDQAEQLVNKEIDYVHKQKTTPARGNRTLRMHYLARGKNEYKIKNLCLAGGVSANKGLRQSFTELGIKKGWHTFIPAFQYCTDNAGMIAITAYYKYCAGQFDDLSLSSSAKAQW